MKKSDSTTDPLVISGMHDGAHQKVFDNARKLRGKMTEAERILWSNLRMKSLGLKFRRQHPINKYVWDFYCHEKRLSIELDGKYHNKESQKQHDRERTKYLNSVGIREIRFSNDQVKNNIEVVLTRIKENL